MTLPTEDEIKKAISAACWILGRGEDPERVLAGHEKDSLARCFAFLALAAQFRKPRHVVIAKLVGSCHTGSDTKRWLSTIRTNDKDHYTPYRISNRQTVNEILISLGWEPLATSDEIRKEAKRRRGNVFRTLHNDYKERAMPVMARPAEIGYRFREGQGRWLVANKISDEELTRAIFGDPELERSALTKRARIFDQTQ